MRPTRDDILKSALIRPRRSRLMTADRYMRSMEACFNGSHCPANLFQAASPAQWEQSLKEAASKLIWTDPAAAVDVHPRHHGERLQPLTPGAVMDFEAVITTTRRDRDRDIMEASGARVDPGAVLLWQHVPMLPIGRLLRVTEQTDARVKARLSIADTELGRDAAVLAEFGALKISHGFEPLEYEPLPDAGWHFKRFEIYEVSLVSVPSNREAVITAFSRDKLQSSLMKSWASDIFRRRAAQVRGTDFVKSTIVNDSKSGDCGCQSLNTSCHSIDDGCAAAGAIFVARAARAGTADLPALQDIQIAVNRIIERLEIEQQAVATNRLLRSLAN